MAYDKISRIKDYIATHYQVVFLVTVVAMGSYYFFGWPISGSADTDFWYHLNGGRYFFRNMTPANSGFFSFIGEHRFWTNYYWLFQVLAYSVFSLGGYYGVVILRAIIFLAFIGCVSIYLLRDEQRNIHKAYLTLIPILLLLVFIPRFFAMMRPHMFSYLFIVLFLIIIESKNKKWLFILPLVSVFWVNFHGVEFPVMLLICIAYLAEILWRKIWKRNIDDHDAFMLSASIILAATALFFTPWGQDLLFVPFESAKFQTIYIAEMRQRPILDFFYFNLESIDTTLFSFSNFLLFLVLLGALIGIGKKKIRVSHLLLFIGSCILIIRGERFRYEAVLLGLPILKNYLLISDKHSFGDSIVKYKGWLLALVGIITLFCFSEVFADRARYPMSEDRLPAGIARFLKKSDAGGRILNHPNHGGYLQWELADQYSIAMDFELMLFNDTDVFSVGNSFTDQHVLSKFIRDYRPAFIVPLLANRGFPNVISAFPDYVPVFFDDAGALYVDKKQHPEIAEKYRLDFIDPFEIFNNGLPKPSDINSEDFLRELNLVYGIYPDGFLVNQILAKSYLKSGDNQKAMQHAKDIVLNFPAQSVGYSLTGDIYFSDRKYLDAVQAYKSALDKTPNGKYLEISKKISACYLALNDYSQCYKFLRKGVELFSPATTYEDYFNLGTLALKTGHLEDGATFLEFARLMTPEEDREMHRKIMLQYLKTQK